MNHNINGQNYLETPAFRSFTAFMRLIFGRSPDGIFEVRIINNSGHIFSGFFNDPIEIAGACFPCQNSPRDEIPFNDAPRITEAQVYITMNPVRQELFERSPNRLKRCGSGQGASDKDIACYNMFFIDLDPVRPGKCSANETERKAAEETAKRIVDEFRANGIEPLMADSGNGYHLYILIKPVYGKDILRAAKRATCILNYLQDRFGTEAVEIDCKVATPAHLMKLPGSLAMKGENTADRPYRFASFKPPEQIPADVDIWSIFREEIEVDDKSPETNYQGIPNPEELDYIASSNRLRTVLEESGFNFKQIDKEDRTIFAFYECPHHSGNKDDKYECSVMVFRDGKYGAKCMHDEKANWHTFKSLIGWDQNQNIIEEYPVPEDQDILEGAPFECLGFDHSSLFFLPHKTSHVIEFQAKDLNNRNLLSLAKLSWWTDNFLGDKNKVLWDRAADTVIQACQNKGVFTPAKIRGKGTWFENGRYVVHLGTLIRDGDKLIELGNFDSSFTYERRTSFPGEEVIPDPLSDQDANRFLDLFTSLPWENKYDGFLYAGWVVLAPHCGALQWRPHAQITGPSGSGKTWIGNKITVPCLGPNHLNVASNTSEAGIRQSLNNDAFPIVFDEAESENAHSADNLQKVFELARQSSSGSFGNIIKGSQGGKAVVCSINSCFCFSAIGITPTLRADLSRISILSLRHPGFEGSKEQFDIVKKLTRELITEENTSKLRERTYRNLCLIIKNSEILSEVICDITGSRRDGDQKGTLLAGAFSLVSTEELTYETAEKWLAEIGFTNDDSSVIDADERQLLGHILSCQISVKFISFAHEITIGELIDFVRHSDAFISVINDRVASQNLIITGQERLPVDKELDRKSKIVNIPDIADQTLKRYGIKVSLEKKSLFIANSNTQLRRLLLETPWSRNWSHILSRLPGAEKVKSERFARGTHPTRAVRIPFTALCDENSLEPISVDSDSNRPDSVVPTTNSLNTI